MREARYEEARSQTEKVASAWAVRIAEQQDAADDSHPLDGWNRPMLLIMLPGDRAPGDAIARIISDGPDETPGTVDDLSADVYPDGTMAVLQSASERISPN